MHPKDRGWQEDHRLEPTALVTGGTQGSDRVRLGCLWVAKHLPGILKSHDPLISEEEKGGENILRAIRAPPAGALLQTGGPCQMSQLLQL